MQTITATDNVSLRVIQYVTYMINMYARSINLYEGKGNMLSDLLSTQDQALDNDRYKDHLFRPNFHT